jgi:hypothetical protein
VLIGVEDVAPGVGEEAADGGDQARLVRAGEQQARGVELVDDGRNDRRWGRTIAFRCEPAICDSRLR